MASPRISDSRAIEAADPWSTTPLTKHELSRTSLTTNNSSRIEAQAVLSQSASTSHESFRSTKTQPQKSVGFKALARIDSELAAIEKSAIKFASREDQEFY